MANQILRLPEVQARIGLSKATIYRMVRAEEFPPPVRLTARASGWPADAIDAWVTSRPTHATTAPVPLPRKGKRIGNGEKQGGA